MKTMKEILIIILFLWSGIISAQWVVIDTAYRRSWPQGLYIENFQIRFIDDGVISYAFMYVPPSMSGEPEIHVINSINDGESWYYVYYDYAHYIQYSDHQFPNADTGFINIIYYGAYPTVFRTTTGGFSWESTGLGPTKMFFVNGEKGYGTHGPFFWRYDNGTFTQIYNLNFNPSIQKIFFTKNEIGFWIYLYDDLWHVMRTVDDGESWEIVHESDSLYFYDIAVPSDSVCYIACNSGTILKSIDIGVTWIDLDLNTDFYIRSISFVNELIGFALCADNLVYMTDDGGNSWQIQYLPSNVGNARSITMIDENVGYINCGSFSSMGYEYFGLIIKTENGGFPSSTEEIENKNIFNAYPNPFNNYLNVELKPEYKEIEICDLNGLTVYSQHLKQNNNQILKIELNNLNSGIYFLKIKTNDNYLIRKLIKL